MPLPLREESSIETFGKYVLLEQIAIGGMASVHLAREAHGDQRLVALKQVLPHLVADQAFLTMFLDEARIAARLHHPNVVEIYDLGREGESLFIAMEFVHGEDLRRISNRATELGRKLPFALCARVVREACKGLDYAHKRIDAHGKPLDIVHRDVSPQNLLVSFEGVVKVADFGVAKAADKAHITASGIIKGKHPYMSPEQAEGRVAIDHRTDVFALGIVLYEVLTGMRLFRRATDLQTLQAVAECQVEPPSKHVPSLPPQLEQIVLKALSRDREQRWSTAGELGAALEQFLASQPDSSVQHLGAYVTDLFRDRLEREVQTGRFAPLPSVVTPAPAPDQARTVQLQGPIPQLPAATRPTEPAAPSSRADVPTREARSKRTDVLGPNDATIRVDEVGPIPREPTLPYGRGLVATIPAGAPHEQPNERETLDLRPAAVAQRQIAQLDTLTGTGPLKRRPRTFPRVIALTVLAAALGGTGGWYAVTRLRAAPVTCEAPLEVKRADGKLWLSVDVPQGTALELRAGPKRDVVGMAMVVESGGGRSRLMAEHVEQLPEELFACPATVGR